MPEVDERKRIIDYNTVNEPDENYYVLVDNGTEGTGKANVKEIGPGNMISDAYSDQDTYAVGDVCIHNNILYVCNTEIDTPHAFDLSEWDPDTLGNYCSKLNGDVNEINTNLTNLENITVGTPRKVGKWGNYDRYEVWLEGTTPAMSANTWTQIKSYTFTTVLIIEKIFTISDSGGLIFNDYYTSTTSYVTSYIKSDGIYLRVGNASAFTGQKFYCKVTYVS